MAKVLRSVIGSNEERAVSSRKRAKELFDEFMDTSIPYLNGETYRESIESHKKKKVRGISELYDEQERMTKATLAFILRNYNTQEEQLIDLTSTLWAIFEHYQNKRFELERENKRHKKTSRKPAKKTIEELEVLKSCLAGLSPEARSIVARMQGRYGDTHLLLISELNRMVDCALSQKEKDRLLSKRKTPNNADREGLAKALSYEVYRQFLMPTDEKLKFVSTKNGDLNNFLYQIFAEIEINQSGLTGYIEEFCKQLSDECG